MEEIFTIQNILLYILIINVIGFGAMWIDKRKAQHGSWRIKEKTLFTITLLGGGIGTILGMYAFRHKTQKRLCKRCLHSLFLCTYTVAFAFWLLRARAAMP